MTDTDAQYSILHAFADHGVESEVLATFGAVTRWTIAPRPNPYVDETVAVDLMDNIPEGKFDFGLFHPRCTDVSEMTSISGDPDEHENQVSRAREIAKATCDYWVIENKPRDDLRDPTILNGKQWGLPIKYERAFESNFLIETPPRERELPTGAYSYFYSDFSHEWWLATKGYRHRWPKQHLAKNALPACYVGHLIRSWLETVDERDAAPSQDNNGRKPRRIGPGQMELTEINT